MENEWRKIEELTSMPYTAEQAKEDVLAYHLPRLWSATVWILETFVKPNAKIGKQFVSVFWDGENVPFIPSFSEIMEICLQLKGLGYQVQIHMENSIDIGW